MLFADITPSHPRELAYIPSRQPKPRTAKPPSKWVSEDRFAIQAKATEGNPTKDQMRLMMMQALLADRFKLAVHFEPQEAAVLALTLVKPEKLGPKLRPHAQGPPCDTAPPPGVFPPDCDVMMLEIGSDRMAIGGSRNTTLPLIAGALPGLGHLARPVVDRTGLSGRFDFKLEWSPETDTLHAAPGEPVPDMKGPSFQEALREQLGLKLESTKAKIETLVIDRLDRPSEN